MKQYVRAMVGLLRLSRERKPEILYVKSTYKITNYKITSFAPHCVSFISDVLGFNGENLTEKSQFTVKGKKWLEGPEEMYWVVFQK